MRDLALPPGCRVVALREVDVMPHPTYPAQPQQFSWLAIPEICPPGEGTVLPAYKIAPSWQRRQSSMGM
jgi:hypothetical protein